MLIAGETFPYKPLTDKDRQSVLAFCGGRPVSSTEYLRGFLATSGMPLIGKVSYFIGELAQRSVAALDRDSPEAVRAFNRGALFYAGVLNVASQPQIRPFDVNVLHEAREADGQNFALDSYQTVQLEAASFCDLAEEVRPAMETKEDPALHQISLVGAGAVHLLVVRSISELTDSSPDALAAAHPELADLPGFE